MVFCGTVVAGVPRHGRPGDDHRPDGNQLQHANSAPGEGVLQALAKGDTDPHRLLHHDDVTQREGEEEERNDHQGHKPLRGKSGSHSCPAIRAYRVGKRAGVKAAIAPQ